MAKIEKFLRKNFPIIILISLTIFLRFFGVFDWFFWNIDEDIHTLTAIRILIDHRLTLIGVTLPNGIHLGPGFFYLESFFLALSWMDPFILPVASSILAVVLALLVYKTAATIFESNRIALFSLILFSSSYLINVYSRMFHPLTFAPILACLVYLIIWRNLKERKMFMLPMLAIILGYSLQGEGTPISLIFLAALSWIIWRFPISKKNLLIILVTFSISILPLLIFELRHNFIQSQRLINSINQARDFQPDFKLFISSVSLLPQTMSRIIYPSGPLDVASQILQCPDLQILKESSINPFVFVGIILVLALFALQIIRRPTTFGVKIIVLHLLIVFFGLSLFNLLIPGYTPEWTMMILLPAMVFIMAFILDLIYQVVILRPLALIVLAVVVSLNILLTLRGEGRFSLAARAEATQWAIAQINGLPYSLNTLGNCFEQGYNYLFWYYGWWPERSYSDDHLSPTYYLKKPNPQPELAVVMVNASENENRNFFEKYNRYKSKAVRSRRFGEIEVIILEDKEILR